jgi:acetone carboxylase gamma subunit
MTQRVSEYLVISNSDGKKVISCRKCHYVFGAATENCKNQALVKECSLAKSGALFLDSERFIFREFYCPGCGTMFDVEVCLKSSPFMWDAHLKV